MCSGGRRTCHYRHDPRRCAGSFDEAVSVVSSSVAGQRGAPSQLRSKSSSSSILGAVGGGGGGGGGSSFLRIGNQGTAASCATSFAAAVSPVGLTSRHRHHHHQRGGGWPFAPRPQLGPNQGNMNRSFSVVPRRTGGGDGKSGSAMQGGQAGGSRKTNDKTNNGKKKKKSLLLPSPLKSPLRKASMRLTAAIHRGKSNKPSSSPPCQGGGGGGAARSSAPSSSRPTRELSQCPYARCDDSSSASSSFAAASADVGGRRRRQQASVASWDVVPSAASSQSRGRFVSLERDAGAGGAASEETRAHRCTTPTDDDEGKLFTLADALSSPPSLSPADSEECYQEFLRELHAPSATTGSPPEICFLDDDARNDDDKEMRILGSSAPTLVDGLVDLNETRHSCDQATDAGVVCAADDDDRRASASLVVRDDPEPTTARPPGASTDGIIREIENRILFNRVLRTAEEKRGGGMRSTPEMFYEGYRGHLSGSFDDDARGVPSVRPAASAAVDGPGEADALLGELEEEVPDAVGRSAPDVDEAADSTLAWSVLSALLGSPAPRSVLASEKRRRRSGPVNLWQDEGLDDECDDGEDSDNCSLPSLSPEGSQFDDEAIPDMDDGCSDDLPGAAIGTPITAPASDKDLADSTLAWTALSAILGSPAPVPARRKRTKRKPLNILFGDGHEVDDALPEIDEEDESVGCMSESKSDISLTELEVAQSGSEVCLNALSPEDGAKEGADSTLAWGVLGMLLGSPAPASVSKRTKRKPLNNLWEDGQEHDEALPDINEHESVGCMSNSKSDISLTELEIAESGSEVCLNALSPEDGAKEGADSALAWGVLGMLLGSPAPASVSMGSKKAPRRNPFLDGNAAADGETDAIPSIYEDEHDDNNTIPSIDEEGDDVWIPIVPEDQAQHETVIPDVEDHASNNTPPVVTNASDKNEVANSAIAWGALAALLGSPAPVSVVGKKSRREKGSINLWNDGDAPEEDLDNVLQSYTGPCIRKDTATSDTDETVSMPSLSGTLDDESAYGSYDSLINSPQRNLSKKSLADDATIDWGTHNGTNFTATCRTSLS